MSNTLKCTVVGQAYVTNSGTFGNYGSAGGYAGANTSNYYVTAVKFTTPDFAGKFEKLDVGFYIKSQYHANINLRWALCSSDENKLSYRRTYAAVTDEHQLTTGILTMTGMSTSAMKLYYIEINAEGVQPSTDYYLFFWGTSNASLCGVGTPDNHVINVTYSPAYTISFVSSGIGVTPGAVEVVEGESVTLPTLDAEGYRFLGWSEYQGDDSGMTGSYTPTGSVTLYAIWVAIFTVTYSAGGIVEDPEPVTVTDGESIELPILTANGYRFAGWSEYQGDGAGITGEYTPAGSVTLYAVWIVLYTVSFDAGGHTEDPAAETVTAGDYVYLPDLYVEGYQFRGWASDPSEEYGMTGEYFPEGSVTLYAIWIAVYTVTYDAGGITYDPMEETVTDGEYVYLPVLEADGYRFVGWTEIEGGTVGETGEYYPQYTVTLYAVWVQLYTVWFDANGVAEDPETVTVEAGDSISLPVIAASGYLFLGWAEDPAAQSGMIGKYTPEYSVTLFAVWSRAGSYFRVMHNGELRKCPIRILHKSELIRCKARIMHNGELVPL